jgi:periplasmic protein TonB
MFDDLVVSSANPKKTNKSWTVVLSAMIQAGLLGILILIPLIYTEALPKQMLTTFLVPPPPPPPPPPPAAAVQRVVKPVQRLIHNGQMLAPTVIPKKVQMIKEEELPPDVGSTGVVGGVPGGVPGGQAGGVLGGIIGGTGSALPPPPKDRQDGSHFRHGCPSRGYFQGRFDSGVDLHLRSAVADEERDGRGPPVALQTHLAQW